MTRSAYGKLTIDCAALRNNYALLQQKVGNRVNVAAVVKANAYGLGAAQITRELTAAGCTRFFVASLQEALPLRAAFPDIEILILNGFFESAANDYLEHKLIPVLGSFIETRAYQNLALKTGKALPAILHFNTRMNRLGFDAVEAKKLIETPDILNGINVQFIMSHLACADTPDHPMNATQLEVFNTIAQHFPNTPKAFANSSGIFLGTDYHFDMVRPGMALYGLNPTPALPNPMQPVVALSAPILRTRLVYKGAHVGYRATYEFENDTPIATVSVGYADGIFWNLSNSGAFYWNGVRCPIRGRVSMDMTTIDLSGIPENQRPKPGDFMEILGPHQSPADLARDAGSFDYEVLTSLSHRYDREYINQG
jgi:alanine racemase